MGMNRTLAITAIALVAVVMVVGAVTPAMAQTGIGKIISINKAGNHGMIECHPGDICGGITLQFNIPGDLTAVPYDPKVGDIVKFTYVPDNSRHATEVFLCSSFCPGF